MQFEIMSMIQTETGNNEQPCSTLQAWYLNFKFLQHVPTADLVESSNTSFSDIDFFPKTVQVSMEGPSVNWNSLI